MATTDMTNTLTELLEPAAEAHGFELVAVEQSGGRHTPVLRVLLDREGDLDLDAICEANGWITELIDEVPELGGPFTLEVSSPGVDRPLRKLDDFGRFAGETAKIKTRADVQGRHAWTGTLIGIEGTTVLLDVEGERISIPHAEIVKARLKGVVSFDRERGVE